MNDVIIVSPVDITFNVCGSWCELTLYKPNCKLTGINMGSSVYMWVGCVWSIQCSNITIIKINGCLGYPDIFG